MAPPGLRERGGGEAPDLPSALAGDRCRSAWCESLRPNPGDAQRPGTVGQLAVVVGRLLPWQGDEQATSAAASAAALTLRRNTTAAASVSAAWEHESAWDLCSVAGSGHSEELDDAHMGADGMRW